MNSRDFSPGGANTTISPRRVVPVGPGVEGHNLAILEGWIHRLAEDFYQFPAQQRLQRRRQRSFVLLEEVDANPSREASNDDERQDDHDGPA